MTKELFINDEVWAQVVDHFESEQAALSWFVTPILALGGQSPDEYFKVHHCGDKKVLELLNKLKHGMTA
ncbi:MAG: DUF2384 domain-containing protein [Oceanospirillales bacterium]|nr:DUF2384 domain-containing protein [Oceanospirillales bacterium]